MEQLIRSISALLMLVLAYFSSNAQLIDFDSDEIERDFVRNTNLYANAFIGPIIDAYGTAQVTGWAPQGELLKPYRFAIGLQTNTSFLKSSDLQFNVNDIPFTDKLRLADPSDPFLPTILGGSTEKQFIYRVEGTLSGPVAYEQAFDALSGTTTPFDAIPSASIQASMGLPHNLEVSLRMFPYVKVGELTHFQIGAGVRHDYGHYFLDEDGPISMSGGIAFHHTNFAYALSEFLDGDNQEVRFTDNSLFVHTDIAYRWKFLGVVARLGYYNTSTKFSLNGTYAFEVKEQTLPPPAPPTVQEAFEVENPVTVSASNGRISGGFGLNIFLGEFATLTSNMQFAEYNTLSIGLHFNFN